MGRSGTRAGRVSRLGLGSLGTGFWTVLGHAIGLKRAAGSALRGTSLAG